MNTDLLAKIVRDLAECVLADAVLAAFDISPRGSLPVNEEQ